MMTFLEWLLEAMVMPSTLPSDVSVRVLNSGQDKVFKVSNGIQEFGRLKLRKIQDDLWCPHNKASQGYGPFLYDLAIEYATLFGKGVLPATGAADIYGVEYYNTEESNTVWKYYFNNRNDVKHRLHRKAVAKKSPWLYCIYTKKPIMIDQLQVMKRISFSA